MGSESRQFAEQVIAAEINALRGLVPALDEHFDKAVRLVLDCPGAVLTSGIGKAGHVARKLSASLSSTGTPSHFLNPAEAMHGDLGSVRRGDVVVVLSYSGESDEILRMLSVLKKLGAPVIAMTSGTSSQLGRNADVVLKLGRIEEACPLGLAPSASTTAMTALGDALFLTVMKWRKFTAEEFALYHPAGQLGRKLIRVREAMTFRAGENLPIASDRLSVKQVLHDVSAIKRRSGAVILVDDAGKISGIFTDGDLRRTFTDVDAAAALARPIRDVMTRNPRRIHGDQLASEAIALMRPLRIDELPVVDGQDRPIGLIDIQDIVVLRMLDVEPGDDVGNNQKS
jgi:arabinose-5-phosphate isomerase